MGFFKEIGKKTSETTTKIAREAKLKMKITENKGKIKDMYQEIGRKVYENHVREENIELKETEEARKEILVLNNKKLCKKCFAEIEKDAMFCSKCGEKQTEEKTVFEKAEEKLDNTEISPQNEKEAEIVKEQLEEKNNEE